MAKFQPANNIENSEQGRLLFSHPCCFVVSAAERSQVPNSTFPEIAFVGRSNVGKSSLINALTFRKELARTSKMPGRTQQINFFLLHNQIMLADLPGYGFANAPKNIIDRWTALIEIYLRGRSQLRRCLLLVDSRHGLKSSDKKAMELLDQAGQSYQIILTKCDKIKVTFQNKIIEEITNIFPNHAAAYPDIIVSSSHKGVGLDKIRASIASLVAPIPQSII